MEKPIKIYRKTKHLYTIIEEFLNKIIGSQEYTEKMFTNLVVLPHSKALNRIRSFLGNNLVNYPMGNFVTLHSLKETILSYVRIEEKLNKNCALSKIGKNLILSDIIDKIKLDYSKSNYEKEKEKIGRYLDKLINPTKFTYEISNFISAIKIMYYKLFDNIESFNSEKDSFTNEIYKMIDKVFSNLLKSNPYKYTDIIEVIKRYEKQKEKFGFLDDEDMLIQTNNHLNSIDELNSPYFSRIKTIRVYGVYEASLLDIELLNSFSKALNANIEFTVYDCKNNDYIFDYLSDLGFKEKNMKELHNSPPLKDLSYMLFQEELFNNVNINTGDYVKHLNFIEENTREDEITTISKTIKEILRNDNTVKANDILIACPDLSAYKTRIKNAFDEIGIDVHISQGESLLNSKLIYVLLNILELKIFNFRYSDFIKLVKSNYVFIREGGKYTNQYPQIIENFFLERKINEYGFIKQIEKYIEKREYYNKEQEKKNSKSLNDLKAALNYIKNVRKLFFNNTLTLPDSDKEVNFYDIISSFRKLIEDDLSILRNVFINKERKDKEYFTDEELAVSGRDSIIFGRFLEITEELGFYYNHINKKLSLRDFYNLLKQTLAFENFNEDTDFRNKVQVYSVDEAYSMKFKYVFIPGMVENGFPRRHSSSVFISDRDKSNINEMVNANILKRQEAFYNKEEDIFKLIFDMVETKLFLSSMKEDEGKISLISFFIDEIQELLKDENEELNEKFYLSKPKSYYYKRELVENTLEIYNDSIIDIINTVESCDILIQNKLSDFKNFMRSVINDIDKGYLKRISSIINMEALRENNYLYTDYDGNLFYNSISKEVRQYIENKFESISPTSFELYSTCPMRFFSIKLLGLKEPKSVEDILSPAVRGTAVHQILEDFYKDYVRDYLKKVNDSNFENIKKELKAFLEESIDKEFNSLNEDNKIANFDLFQLNQMRRIKNKILEFFDFDFKVLKDQGYTPKFFEFSFGMNSEDSKEALKLYDESGDHISNIKGSIDRIDEAEKDLISNSIKVSDYKTERNRKSEKKIKKLIKEGQMFQPVLYSLRVLDSDEFDYDAVDWIFYYIFDLPKTKQPTIHLKKDSEEIKASVDYIKDYKEKISNGNFNLAPHDCPIFCKFSDACRYKKYRTEEKRDNTKFWVKK